MNILVTGGAGFIGSNLVDKLIALGHQVTVVDNESAATNSKFYWNSSASNHRLDISNFTEIEPLFKDIDYVFHMAAQARIQTSVDNPIATVQENILGTTNVLEASKRNKVCRVIYSMTSSIYGSNPTPHIESMPPLCSTPYSVSKLAGEQLCKVYSSLYGLDTASLRYFNVYGDREPSSGPYATVINKFLMQKKSNASLTVVGDGEQRRDFTNIADVVDANIAAMNYLPKLSGEIFNIGTGINYSINQVASLISDDVIHIKARPGENRETLADISKAKSLLLWAPTVSLEDYINLKVSF